MKVFQTIEVSATTTNRCVKHTCDLCGAESKEGDWIDPRWDNSDTTVEITAKRAKYWGNYGNSTKYEIDICPKCFWERLIPWFNSQGAKVKPEDYNW